MSSDFVHLHCHTEYSMLDGAIRLGDLVARAKDLGMPACAVTDHGNMYAAAQFQTLCNKYGMKPIFGCEVYTCRDHLDRTDKKRNHLILLARTMEGYHNLVKIVTKGALEGFYFKPRVDWDIIKDHAAGITCLSACLQGEIPQAILNRDMDLARELCGKYAATFKDHFFLEVQENGIREQSLVNAGLRELGEDLGLPVVATNDCHYLNPDDVQAHEILLCIGTGSTINDPKRFKFRTDQLYYKTQEEMAAQFRPEEIANSARIAEECDVTLTFGKHYFPNYPIPKGATLESEFRRLAEEGLERRLREHPDSASLDKDTYRRRLQYEIGVILEMGFPGYFLIVQEFINWAKNNGVPVGPGRGSAAGSVAVWSLRITNLDPMPYNLLFERFLNIERISLPDIDVDFCERRRGEVIRHMADRYGADSVSQIAAFGTMKARAVIHDVGRVLGMTFAERAAIAKLVPANNPKIHIKDVLESEPEFKRLYESDRQFKRLIEISMRLEGLTRQAGMHAAGLVVSDKPMVEYLPLFLGRHDEQVTQFDGPMVEQTGLVKFDFLGLKTMTLIQDTLDNIRLEGAEPPDLDRLPFTDMATYELYSRGDTDGIFQVEGAGMKEYLKKLKPSCFEDVIAMLALYRPGPLGSGMVDEFIKRKHGEVPVIYPHESLKGCLADTYGVIVYQEQVMQIAQIIASYTLGGADLLRRAMGKKKAEAMAKERVNFVAGAERNHIGREKANEIFDLMEKFAAYGFNKSHSAAYAQISYYTAYLKVHHFCEFMAALLTSEMGNQDKLLKYISCCKERSVEVVAPSVNYSLRQFTARQGKVVFGLGGIKNVGDEAIQEILANREKGPYLSLYDLCCRVNLRKVTRRVLEALIKGGAFDGMGATRQALLSCLAQVMERVQRDAKKKTSRAGSLLAFVPRDESAPRATGVGLPLQDADADEFPEQARLQLEKEVLGFYLSSHPLQPYMADVRARGDILSIEQALETAPRGTVSLAVLVTDTREVLTKKNSQRMAFLQVEDLTGHGEATIFPKAYTQEVRDLLAMDKPLWLQGRVDTSRRDDFRDDEGDMEGERQPEFKLIVERIRLLDTICPNAVKPFTLDIQADHLGADAMRALRAILERHSQGTFLARVRVQVHLEDRVETGWVSDLRVETSPALTREIEDWAARRFEQARTGS